ncbi:MAG: SusC/RagA family TonB-linked outer membrane protein [Bacteroides sp.]|nr:SusC/RagA family TonB-linked outer membrane protein [Bacteroides sp.]
MKQSLIIFLMLLSIAGVSANSYSQNLKLALKLKNKTLKELFSEIEKQSEFIFLYTDEVNVNEAVNISVEDATIHEVMEKVLDQKQSGYKVVERQVILFKKDSEAGSESAKAATRPQQSETSVKGHIKSTTGEPLIGVSVVEKGTSKGTITDFDGNYSIEVAHNAILIFSYIGFESQEVPVNGKTQLNVVMKEDVAALDEVIVVAYGTQKKSSVTGSISVVNAEKLKTATSPNVNTMLQGKVPGVQVLNTSGKPGEAATIRIRGKGSLSSEVNPLWVIDGVISGVGAQLNPNEIETISVLKDAAATALYGSRATNGVILVTTKSGRMGENKIDVSAKFSISQQNLGKFKLMNSRELYDYTSKMDKLDIPWFNESLLTHDTDWFKMATQSAFTQNYTLSYSMGNEKVRSFLSGDYYNEEGTVKGYDYNRYSIRSNIDYYFNKRLTLKTKLSGTYMHDESREHSLHSAMTYLPWDTPYNEDGSMRTGQEDDWKGRDKNNYLYNLQWNWGRKKQLGVTGSAGFDYKLTDHLTFESNNNISFRYIYQESYVDPRSMGASEYNGSIENVNELYTTCYANQLLRFNNTYKDVHAFNAFLGYEYSDYKYEKNGAIGRGIPQGGEVLEVSSSPYSTTGQKGEWAMQSFYFNANYTYNDKYMAQFSYRIDGSSRFGSNNRYGGFFTLGGAWSIHNEPFMKRVNFVDQLKLRASYGSIGNTPGGGNYGYLSVYSLDTHYNGVPAAFPKRLGNPDLTWEKCYQTNIGLDTRLFNRVNISFDYYHKNTSDLLYLVQLTSLTGYESQYRNIGAVKNEGFEMTVSPDIIRTKDFLWTLDFNIGYNKGKIKKTVRRKTADIPP